MINLFFKSITFFLIYYVAQIYMHRYKIKFICININVKNKSFVHNSNNKIIFYKILRNIVCNIYLFAYNIEKIFV